MKSRILFCLCLCFGLSAFAADTPNKRRDEDKVVTDRHNNRNLWGHYKTTWQYCHVSKSTFERVLKRHVVTDKALRTCMQYAGSLPKSGPCPLPVKITVEELTAKEEK